MFAADLPPRFHLLTRLREAQERVGFLPRETVTEIARALRIPLAEAWEAATSYPLFRLQPSAAESHCGGLSCAVNGGQSITSKPARMKWWRTNGNEFMSVELSA